jgi:RNA recognition motif-containing protein
MDPTSGRTKGYGFVTFTENSDANRALAKNGELLKGRKMRVNWASTTKDHPLQKSMAQFPPPDAFITPQTMRNDVQIALSTMAQYDGLDVGWYMRLPADVQAGIMRVSHEAPGAKVVWVGNLDKATSRMSLKDLTNIDDLMPLFSAYGLVEEITMVSPNGYAFVSYSPSLFI